MRDFHFSGRNFFLFISCVMKNFFRFFVSSHSLLFYSFRSCGCTLLADLWESESESELKFEFEFVRSNSKHINGKRITVEFCIPFHSVAPVHKSLYLRMKCQSSLDSRFILWCVEKVKLWKIHFVTFFHPVPRSLFFVCIRNRCP